MTRIKSTRLFKDLLPLHNLIVQDGLYQGDLTIDPEDVAPSSASFSIKRLRGISRKGVFSWVVFFKV